MKALIQTGSSLSACGHAQAGGRVPVPLKSDFLSMNRWVSAPFYWENLGQGQNYMSGKWVFLSKRLLGVVILVGFPPLTLSAEIVLKGIRLGMDIEQARERALTKMEAVQISPVMPLPGERSCFKLNGGQGIVMANDHERVEAIVITPQLAQYLFGLAGLTKEEFARVLTEVWGLQGAEWQTGIEMPDPHIGMTALVYIQCFLPDEGASVTVYDNNGLSIRKHDKELRKRIK